MLRRQFVGSVGSAAVGLALPNRPAAQLPIYYELHGNPNGRPLFVGFPIMASYGAIFGAANVVA